MKVVEPAVLLVVGTVFLTFCALSFGLIPRPLSASNPNLVVEALGAAGAVMFGLGARGLYRVHQALNAGGRASTSRSAAA